METVIELDRILFKEGDNHIAEVDFPTTMETVNKPIRSWMKPYRGQGLAGRLLDEVVKELRKRKEKAIPMCSYF